jgi:hypothetical protein
VAPEPRRTNQESRGFMEDLNQADYAKLAARFLS